MPTIAQPPTPTPGAPTGTSPGPVAASDNIPVPNVGVGMDPRETTPDGDPFFGYKAKPNSSVLDMNDFHVTVPRGYKLTGQDAGSRPPGWQFNITKTGAHWYTGDTQGANPLEPERTYTFGLIVNRQSFLEADVQWWATRDGQKKVDVPGGGTTPRPVPRGSATPRRRKDGPIIDRGPDRNEPSTKGPVVTLGIPEYSLGEPDTDNEAVGITAGETWTATINHFEGNSLFAIVLSEDRDASECRTMGGLPLSNNLSFAEVIYFENNFLDQDGICRFAISVAPDTAVGIIFYAIVFVDDGAMDGFLNPHMTEGDYESVPFKFIVQ
ncbi:MAG: hypothetical protein COU08_01390 [Candidatus Harrisonbacteria bacterium CG10_big_fil_rev_8_21_14_0_10_42_17]|uniref:Uncharacterized protein n=1 Tax=Candidatus Harrisonbacteria bacterium CG10_big_fil_rev_8_21_14_0_10_42_17 TaxID=1974584 RepID=A0A2M6WIK7_9BACT|nr:MAG: hypothetical protein COU08_01390 [Candidatus Harrisonbacteria bacterium CG10_big_fil_rev_8_21_14_0_10_42_17]